MTPPIYTSFVRPFAAVIMLLQTACEPTERARFLSPTTETLRFSSHTGVIAVAKGLEVSPEGVMRGNETSLLHLVVVCPTTRMKLSGGGIQHHGSDTLYSWKWGEGSKSISSSVSWDRVSDTIGISDREYQRAEGAVFVILLWKNRDSEVIQIKSPDRSHSPRSLLKFLKALRPEHRIIQDLKLPVNKGVG